MSMFVFSQTPRYFTCGTYVNALLRVSEEKTVHILIQGFCAGEDEPQTKVCVGYYGSQPMYASWDPTAGRLMPSCSQAPPPELHTPHATYLLTS